MAAGIATVSHLLYHRQEIYPKVAETTAAIVSGVARLAAERGLALTSNSVGSMFTWFFTPGPVTDFTSASASDTALFARFHRGMLDRGVWLPPSQYEAAFVSTAHGQAEVDAVLAAASEVLQEISR